MLSRLLSGAAPTVGGAFIVTLAATLCGLVLGVVAGATHGLRSAVLNHILDTLLSIPSLLLAIIVVAFAGPHLSRDVCRLAGPVAANGTFRLQHGA